MVECSLCAILSFLFSCIFNLLSCALEYPIVVFLLSFLIAVVFVANVHAAKLICEFRYPGRCSSSSSNTNARENFNYGPDCGPHSWDSSDANQSPINIVDDYVQKLPIRELLTWNHYDDLPCSVILENNGHTVIIRANFSGNTPTVSGADLLACYTFVELCFRWNALGNDGSEHMLNYRKYPMELQSMHRTGPANDCTSSYDLLMIAYFFELSSHNPYLDPIVQHLHRIRKPCTKVEIPPFPLAYLCHQFRTGFYSYGGSLTEPPCYQGAEWFVFPEPLAISEQQLNEFRQLLSSDGKTRILRNSRPVQCLNSSRVVSFNQYNPCEARNNEQASTAAQCENEDNAE